MTGFEVLAARAFYRPAGTMRLDEAVERIALAMQHARALDLDDILINTTDLHGFESPGVFERYAMITRWVRCAGTALRFAVVARPSLIDYQKIGVMIAQNRGASAEVFTDEPSALRWLDMWRTRPHVRWPARQRAPGR